MMDDQTTRAEGETSDNLGSEAEQPDYQEQVTTGAGQTAGEDYAVAEAADDAGDSGMEAEDYAADATDDADVAVVAESANDTETRTPVQESGRGGGRGRDPKGGRNAGYGGSDDGEMAALLAESERQPRQFKRGDVIEGIVMRKDHDEILVDIGAKSEGVIPNSEMQSLTTAEMDALEIGDELLVAVVQGEDREGHVTLSVDLARQEKSWRTLQRQFENNEVIEAEVTGYNKGGLLVNLEGVRGFVPASQVTGLSTGGNEASKQSELARFTGQHMPLKIIEINRNRNRLILSERQAAQEQRDARKELLLAELQPQQIRPGTVSSICDFGAFVDIGGADGLIHLSELSWSRVNHPNEVLRVGQQVQVFVMSVDERDRKIALSLKRTQPEPWSTAMDRYALGQLVRGSITQLTDFGAFARLEDGIEGLIHVSELAEGRVTHPRNVVQEGQEVTLRVIRIDPQRRRMGLSLKRAMEPQEGDTLPPQEPLPPVTPRAEGDTAAGRNNRAGGGRGRRDEQAVESDEQQVDEQVAGADDQSIVAYEQPVETDEQAAGAPAASEQSDELAPESTFATSEDVEETAGADEPYTSTEVTAPGQDVADGEVADDDETGRATE